MHITYASGTATTLSTSARYIQLGKTVIASYLVTHTSIGTAGTALFATYPVAPLTGTGVNVVGYGSNSTQATTAVVTQEVGVPRIVFRKYDGTFGISNGDLVCFVVVYEAA